MEREEIVGKTDGRSAMAFYRVDGMKFVAALQHLLIGFKQQHPDVVNVIKLKGQTGVYVWLQGALYVLEKSYATWFPLESIPVADILSDEWTLESWRLPNGTASMPKNQYLTELHKIYKEQL